MERQRLRGWLRWLLCTVPRNGKSRIGGRKGFGGVKRIFRRKNVLTLGVRHNSVEPLEKDKICQY